jgi:hypothetical protein
MNNVVQIRAVVDYVIVWKRALRPTAAEIESSIKDFLDGDGEVIRESNRFSVSLQGTPGHLQDQHTARWFHVVLKDTDSVVISSPVNDEFTLALAEALHGKLQNLQMLEDQEAADADKDSEAAP